MPAQEIGLNLTGSGPTVTLLSSNISNGVTSPATDPVDFGTPTPLEIGFTVQLNCAVSANDTATLKIMWSHDNETYCDNLNAEDIVTVECSQLLTAKKTGSFPVKARYAKFQLLNESGGIIASPFTSLKLWDIFGNTV